MEPKFQDLGTFKDEKGRECRQYLFPTAKAFSAHLGTVRKKDSAPMLFMIEGQTVAAGAAKTIARHIARDDSLDGDLLITFIQN